MSKIQGVNIREVWDYLLSSAVTLIVREGGTWVCQIWAKSNPDYINTPERTVYDYDEEGEPIEGTERIIAAVRNKPALPLETHDTGIKFEKGDQLNPEKLIPCFEWFKSRRDDYALPNIEELKPKFAIVRHINDDLHERARGIPTQAEYRVFSAQYALDLINLAKAS